MDAAAEVAALRRALERVGTPARAEGGKRYLKSPLVFLGATVPAMRTEARRFSRAHPDLTAAELRALVDAAWATEVYELRTMGALLLEAYVSRLEVKDVPRLERLLRQAGTWALIDLLAPFVLGPLYERGVVTPAQLADWARDPDFWVRRAALLTLLLPLRRGDGDFALFTRLAVPLLPDTEFFVRKAIGWVLRETAKKRPALTFQFLREHRAAVSGLTLREGARALPAPMRTALLSETAPRSARKRPPARDARRSGGSRSGRSAPAARSRRR